MRKLLSLATASVLVACANVTASPDTAYDRMDDRDVRLASATVQNTLETGDNNVTAVWQNTENGHAGATTPLRTFVTDSGVFCRDYLEVLIIEGRPARFANTACRSEAGSWVWSR